MSFGTKDITNSITNGGARVIGGIPLLIIMTLNGSSGIDLLDALIIYVSALAG
jgi:hypothetical protein